MTISKYASVFGAAIVALLSAPLVHATSVSYDFEIFTDGFETPQNTSRWQVYQTFGDWETDSGAGIEIQRSGVVVQANDGNQYVELDSHNNSTMSRDLTLGAGNYQLTWFYQPRTNTANDNIINVLLESQTSPLTINLGTQNGTGQSGWQEITATFAIQTLGAYSLIFSADGISNSFGGFVDSVSLFSDTQAFGREDLSPVPLPAAAWLFLSVLGAGGLLRRAKGQR